MKHIALGKALWLGFFIWLVPFALAFAIFPIRASNRPLFESLIMVIGVLAIMVASVMYRRKHAYFQITDGILLGCLWMVESVILDFYPFIIWPIHMPLDQYIADIAVGYLAMPVVTTALAWLDVKSHPTI